MNSLVIQEEENAPCTPGNIDYLCHIKSQFLNQMCNLRKLSENIDSLCHEIGGYAPYRIEYRFENFEENREEKYIDRCCWMYVINHIRLERYMLRTEYDKMISLVTDFRAPIFNKENGYGWIQSLKGLIYDNVKTLVKKVYQEIITGTYRTGNNWRYKKKRNNNGIDSFFILHTADSSRIPWSSSSVSVTDDLEKVCYLLDGEELPEKTAIMTMQGNKTYTYDGKYFSLRLCSNGNTHYRLNEEIRKKLNIYGPDGNAIGENIKIKMFDTWARIDEREDKHEGY